MLNVVLNTIYKCANKQWRGIKEGLSPRKIGQNLFEKSNMVRIEIISCTVGQKKK